MKRIINTISMMLILLGLYNNVFSISNLKTIDMNEKSIFDELLSYEDKKFVINGALNLVMWENQNYIA
ncbi:hypothetical protein [Candidatus Babela massiliensis]|uniref:Uncharacterized protein n=1 Tax=Candidatus Babela massiliensis TaxID=673862 RepID=V6DEX7_9BACT|nr:hypothetical protein [Candidatus Babela massiliensis]CDK30130.1 hypothetical protein BABL1_gene_824 [Candidatus Babela massiliensis]